MELRLISIRMHSALDSPGKSRFYVCVSFNRDVESQPKPFKCDIVARSSQAAKLVRAAALVAQKNVSAA